MTTHLPEKHAGDEPFRLRVYGKAELACLYFPNASPETARRNLHRWIWQCPCIREELIRLGHDKHSKHFLKPEVEAIVRGLGEP